MNSPTPAASRAATLPADIRAVKAALKPFIKFAQQFESGPGGHPKTDRVAATAGAVLTAGDCFALVKAFERQNFSALAAPEAAQPASPAPLTDAPSVPEDVLILIHKYGDARSAAAGSTIESCELILGLRRWAAALASPQVAPAPEPTYSSTQATKCAGCGKHKHTPLRIDAMGGYVCLTCIDQKLGSMLGEFGYPAPEVAAPVQVAPCRVCAATAPHTGTCSGPHDPRALCAVQVDPQDDARDAAEPQYFDAYLCRAWGETDLPAVELVHDEAGIRAFMVREWLGREDARDGDGTLTLPGVMEGIAGNDWEDDPVWNIEFEIGGVSVERVTGFTPAAKPTEEHGS